MPRPRRSLVGVVLGAAVTAALLAGCAPSSSAYDDGAAEQLQQHVLAVSSASAEADWATAATRSMELEAAATTALARGEITQERFDAIMAALALVRADIEAAVAAAEEEAARNEQAEEDSQNSPGNGRPDKPGKPEKDG